MKQALKSLLGSAALIAISTQSAFAGYHHPRVRAPEIDVGQGLAVLAVLACVTLFLRERYLRQH